MSKHVLLAHINQAFTEVCRIFFEMDIHHLPIVDEKRNLIGILSTNDALKALIYKAPFLSEDAKKNINQAIRLEDIMTPHPLTVKPHDSIDKAAELLIYHKIQSLLVVNEGLLVGIITGKDLVNYFQKENKLEIL